MVGIRLLAKNCKLAAVGKPRTQSEARFSRIRGGYGSALVGWGEAILDTLH